MAKKKNDTGYLNIKMAISQYNSRRPEGQPKLTQAGLAEVVFANDRKRSPSSKQIYISGWSNGEFMDLVGLSHLRAIHETTGISYSDLIK